MKTFTIYKCEKCGREYKTSDEALNCESLHKVPEEVIGYKDFIKGKYDNFPRSVILKYGNQICRYDYYSSGMPKDDE